MNRLTAFVISLLMGLACTSLRGQPPKGVTDRLLEELQGEEKAKADGDAEQPRSWHTLAEEMNRISEQLAQPAASKEILAAQGAVIDELTRLLEKSKEQAGSMTSSAKAGNEKKEASGGGRSALGAKNEDNRGATGDGPATKAGAAGKAAAGGSGNTGVSGDALVRRAWGQLPGRVRERLQAGAPEKFHQKYQAETENYFRRLSEMEHQP